MNMKKIYIIGSSSSIAKSLEASFNGNFETVFFGRTNPHHLKNFISYNGINDENSVSELGKMVIYDLNASAGLKSASLVVLAGVSSKNWTESFLVNEYLPAKLSEMFCETVVSLGLQGNSVTLVGSSAAYQGAKLPYATTKASLSGILHTISRDYMNMARINIILPSAFERGMIANWNEEKRKDVASSNHIGRLGNADDMADAIVFTVKNGFITNSTINMTGGTVHI
jgi:NAD(P)-dependent dehydrogenase (short-subunit alcohol dehydrogenase family)